MAKFWFLLTVAFVDLIVAVVLVNWGHGSIAFLFLLIAALMGGYAFFSTPSLKRDPRGRLQPTEVPYGSVIGTVGAIAILVSAAYVAFISTRPLPPEPAEAARIVPTPRPAPPSTYQPPRSYDPSPASAALYKCVDAQGQSIFQSRPCAAGTTQVWVRDATPEPPRSRAQLERETRARRAAEQQAAYEAAAHSNNAQYSMPDSSSSDSACQAARDADAAYRRKPLQYVTHDGLRRHGDRIREACD